VNGVAARTRGMARGAAARPRTAGDDLTILLAWNAVLVWWKWALPAGLLLAGGLVAFLVATTQEKFEAAGWLRLDDRPVYLAFDLAEAHRSAVAIENQIELLRSPVIIDPVVRKPEIAKLPEIAAERDAAKWLAEELDIRSVGESEFLRVAIATTDPEHSAAIVNAVIESYFNVRAQDESARIQRVIELLEQERAQRAAELASIREDLQKVPGGFPVSPDMFAAESTPGAAAAATLLGDLQQRLISNATDQAILQAQIKAAEMPEGAPQTEPDSWSIERAVTERPEVKAAEASLAANRVRLQETADRSATGERDPACVRLTKEIQQDELELQRMRNSLAEKVTEELRIELKKKRDTDLANMRVELESLQAAAELLQQRYDAQLRESRPAGASPQLVSKRAELISAQRVYDMISERVLKLRTERRAPANVSLVKNAVPPKTSLQGSRNRKIALAAIACLCAPFGLAIGWERLRQRISEPAQLTQETGLLVVGEVARLPQGAADSFASSVLAAGSHTQAFAESIDRLRAVLFLAEDRRDLRVVTVSSAVDGEGKTSTAAALAMSLARESGQPTLLIDGDLRSPRVHELCGIALNPGLAEALHGACSWEQAVVRDASGTISVLPAGTLSGNAHALLGRGALVSAVQRLASEYGYIVIDSPPVLGRAEALLLARVADGCLLCARRDFSRSPEVHKAYEHLVAAGVNPVGAVLTAVSETSIL